MREVCDILIRDSRILTGDFTIEEHVSVAVKDKIIHAIGTPEELDQRFCAAEVLEADGNLLMPGFIDGHTHTCQQLLRGRTADEYPMIWTRFLVPFESNLSPEDVRVSARLHCVEMIRAGITGFADAGGVHMDQVAEAVMETGMRAALCPSTMDMGNVVCGEMKHSAEDCIRLTEELHSRYQGAGDGRVDIWFGIRQLMTCSKELIEKIVEKAEELDTGIHMHLCEHKDEVSFCLQNYKMRPAAFLQSVGALSPRLLTAHNVLLTERDITLLADNGVHVIHCPMADCVLLNDLLVINHCLYLVFLQCLLNILHHAGAQDRCLFDAVIADGNQNGIVQITQITVGYHGTNHGVDRHIQFHALQIHIFHNGLRIRIQGLCL